MFKNLSPKTKIIILIIIILIIAAIIFFVVRSRKKKKQLDIPAATKQLNVKKPENKFSVVPDEEDEKTQKKPVVQNQNGQQKPQQRPPQQPRNPQQPVTTPFVEIKNPTVESNGEKMLEPEASFHKED